MNDINGREIRPGDRIAYANLWGRSAGLVLGEVVDIVNGKVKVWAYRESSGNNIYVVHPDAPARWVQKPNKCLVIS